LRIIRVEGDVGGPGFKDGEQGDDQLRGAFEEEADEGIGAEAATEQEVSELIGAVVQLGIGEAFVLEDESERVRGELNLSLEELMEAEMAVWELASGLIPPVEELALLVG
jgi:hypothetical protein